MADDSDIDNIELGYCTNPECTIKEASMIVNGGRCPLCGEPLDCPE